MTRVTLPSSPTLLTDDLSRRIPKIVIGNPGRQDELAWDIIPNWRPHPSAGVDLELGTVQRNGQEWSIPKDLRTVLSRCDGSTVWDITHEISPGDLLAGLDRVTEDVKAGRVLGIVHWDFVFRDKDGVFFRKRVLGGGPTRHEWFYVPPFVRAVFDRCSGGYSCREIAGALATEGQSASSLLRPVVNACLELIAMEAIDWIDDEILRARRLPEYAAVTTACKASRS